MRKSALLVTAAVVALVACSKSSKIGFSIPAITPPVKAAVPAGYGGGAAFAGTSGGLTDINARFFQQGPTNLFGILQAVDDRMKGLDGACESSVTPVEYAITPFGEPVTMNAQCSQVMSDGSGFVQWAKTADGTVYLYVAIGAGEVAAVVKPSTSVASLPGDAQFVVDVWASVGILNGTGSGAGACGSSWDGCSYGVIRIHADPAAPSFEMTVAGIGFGYCGAQLVADNTNIFAEGSVDAGTTCGAPQTACFLGTDATTPATCTSAEQVFNLPPLGRTSSAGTAQNWGASQYPATPTLHFTGTSGDPAHFGPTSPTI